jgi:homoserine O-succinyltransferase
VVASDAPTGRTTRPTRRVALVNNMPDAALAATERQFVGLLADSGGGDLDVSLHTLAGIRRGDGASRQLDGRYLPLSHLAHEPPAALVVTGTEPLADRLQGEAYWAELVELLRWGITSVPVVLVSCLAAHAALEVFDGLSRVRLADKLTGVYLQRSAAGHPLTRGLAPFVPVPHSRRNDVPVTAVVEAGWQVAVGGSAPAAARLPEPGWAVITADRGVASVTAIQGHLEYEASSLLREYRRDVERFLRGELGSAPAPPVGCVAPVDLVALAAFDAGLREGPQEPARISGFDFVGAGLRAEWSWREAAVGIYRNWLESVVASPPVDRRSVAH